MDNSSMAIFGEDFLDEIKRVERIITLYESVPAGYIAAALMKAEVKQAREALDGNDIVKMINAYSHLKEYKE